MVVVFGPITHENCVLNLNMLINQVAIKNF